MLQSVGLQRVGHNCATEMTDGLKTKIIYAYSLSRNQICLKSKLVLIFYQRMDMMDLIKVLNFSLICFL